MSSDHKYEFNSVVNVDPNLIPDDWFKLNEWAMKLVCCILDKDSEKPEGVIVYNGLPNGVIYHNVLQSDLIHLHDMLDSLKAPVCAWNDAQIEMAREAIRKMAEGIEAARRLLVESAGLQYKLEERERERNG